jgi:hypothetical protein
MARHVYFTEPRKCLFSGTYQQSPIFGRLQGEFIIQDDVIVGTGRDLDAVADIAERELVGVYDYDPKTSRRSLKLLFIVPGGKNCDILYDIWSDGAPQWLNGKHGGTWRPATHYGHVSVTGGPHDGWKGDTVYEAERPRVVPTNRSPSGAEINITMLERVKNRIQTPSFQQVEWLLKRSLENIAGDACIECGGNTDTHVR